MHLRLYDLLFGATLITASPCVLALALLNREGTRERLGLFSAPKVTAPIWVHAASVGEIVGIVSLLPELRRIRPDSSLVISTTTVTGLERARRTLEDADFLFVAPLDFSPIVRRVLGRIRPRSLLIAETELWPNLIELAHRWGAPIGIINARMTARGLSRYLRARGLFERILRKVDLVCVQSEEDRGRFIRMGAPPDRIETVGNLKFDALQTEESDVEETRRQFDLPAGRRIVVGGSTRQGEEEILLNAFARLRRNFDDLLLILAPRHPTRVHELEGLLRAKGFSWVRRSRIGRDRARNAEVVVLDTLGELTRLYAAGDVAFVGGSFVSVGGHSPMEPAAAGVPVLFGPYMEQEGAQLLLDAGAACSVADGESLCRTLNRLLADPEERRRRGRAGQDAVRSARGGTGRTVELLIERGIV